jgi:hypothetical protein
MATPRPKYVAIIDFGRGRDRFLAGQPVTPGPALVSVLAMPVEEQAKFIAPAKSKSSDQPADPAPTEE